MNNLDDFSRLTRFLVRCIDEEALGGLKLRRDHKDAKFITPWQKSEPLLDPNSAEVCIAPATDEERDFFTKLTNTTAKTSRIHYGYPVCLRKDGYLSPLFFIEVDVKAGENGEYKLFPVWRSLGVNLLLLIDSGYSREEANLLARELEGDFGSFTARLDAAKEALELPERILDGENLDNLPKQQSGDDEWFKTPLLFQAQINSAKKDLHFELSQFIKNSSPDNTNYLHPQIQDTALGVLLGLSKPETETKPDRAHRFEVSSLNSQQAEAVDHALTAPLTVVTGPPGTGKSQVVVNILSNCAASGQTVLFASNNNKPMQEVYSRLTEIMGDAGNWVLRLGNKDYREAAEATMLEQLSGQIDSGIPLSRQDILSQLEVLATERDIYERELADIEHSQREIETALEQERTIAFHLPDEWTNALETNAPPLIDGNKLRKITDDVFILAGKKNGGLLFLLSKQIFGNRLVLNAEEKVRALYAPLPKDIQNLSFPDYDQLTINKLLLAVQRLNHHMKWAVALERRSKAEKRLASSRSVETIQHDLALVTTKRVEQGQNFLRADWTETLNNKSARVKDELKRYFNYLQRKFEPGKNKGFYNGFEKCIHKVTEGLPVWMVSSLSVGSCLPLRPALFDCVVIDEASQSDLASIIPLLFRARRAVLVGDPKQLSHIPGISTKQEVRLADDEGVSGLVDDWSPINRSAYDISASAVVGRGGKELLLSQHYRCHPEIIGFSNSAFYGGRLVPRTAQTFPSDVQGTGIHWRHVEGRLVKSKRGAANEAEIEEIILLIESWLTQMPKWMKKDMKLGVVTPFRLNADMIKSSLEKQTWWPQIQERVTVGTTHAFQGSECDVMIFSPVVTKSLRPYLTNFVAESDELLNVAITRAKTALYVVGDRPCCQDAGGALSELVTYVKATEASQRGRPTQPSEAELAFCEILDELNITYQEEYEVHRQANAAPYRLDFMVVSDSGVRYDLEVDGSYHLSNERFQEDVVRNKFLEDMDFKVLRFTAREVFNNKDAVRERLLRLV